MSKKLSGARQTLGDALHHLQTAIDLLDAADAPGTIAAHADLAAQQLKALLVAADARRSADRVKLMEPGENS